MDESHKKVWREIIKATGIYLGIVFFQGAVNYWKQNDVVGAIVVGAVSYAVVYAGINNNFIK